jgi:hypothetical protein
MLDLVKVMRHIAPPEFQGEAKDVMGFIDAVERLVGMNLCHSQDHLLLTVSSSFRGEAASWYRTWFKTTDVRTWDRMKEDLCSRFLGHSFRLHAVKALLEGRERNGDLLGFVKEFRRTMDQVVLAGFELPEDFLKACLAVQLSSDHSAQLFAQRDLSLTKTLEMAERLGASMATQQPRHMAQAYRRPQFSGPMHPPSPKKSRPEVGPVQATANEPVHTSASPTTRVKCYGCGAYGHIRRECPAESASGGKPGKGAGPKGADE